MKIKNIAITLVILAIGYGSNAQVKGGEFGKLFDMYLMGDYASCLKKSEKMLDKSKYRNNPELLLYISMCYYQISIDPELAEETEKDKAYKDALKFAAKAVKKDDDELDLIGQNADFIDNLKVRGAEEARYYFNEDNFRKAASTYARILKVDEEDPGLTLMTGVCQLLAKNVGEGGKLVDEGLRLIKEKYSDSSYNPSELTYNYTIDGLVFYTNYLKDNDEKDKAMDVISSARKTFPKDKDIKMQYDILMR